MSKIQRDLVLRSSINTKDLCSNKFWGLLSLFSCTNEDLKSLTTYTVSVDDLSSRLQDLFFFGNELTDYNSGREVYFQLSNQWETAITELVRNGRVNILDAAIFFFKNEQFDNPIIARALVSRFTQALKVSETVLNRIFELDYDEELSIQIENDYPSSIVLELYKTELEIDNDNVTISFENPFTISSHPGELKRAPFVQTLYSGSAIQEIILLTDFDIDEYYPRETDGLATTSSSNPIQDLNVIYYGPPGTGKTRKIQLNHLVDKDDSNSKFITFHQSYSYEEFIEGLKPLIIHGQEQVYENGKLREFIKYTFSVLLENLGWTVISQNIQETDSSINESPFRGLRLPEYFGSINLFGKFEHEQTATSLSSSGTQRYFEEPLAAGTGEIIYLTTQWGDVDGNGLTFKNFQRFVNKISSGLFTVSKKDDGFTLSQQSEQNSNVIYKIVKGVFYDACESAARLAGYNSLNDCIADTKEKRAKKMSDAITSNNVFVMCIDEINRANISSVFGDLITLIEEKKRLGNSEEMSAILPYSKEKFGVPSNLQIIGTMNTADRSITLLDSALRRRFDFDEVLPQPNVLNRINIDGINVSQLLSKLNKRITYFLGKDQSIGHSYFIGLNDTDIPKKELLSIFWNNIIPLLEEYFYNDIPKIRLVLGESNKSEELCFYKVDEDADVEQLFGSIEDDIDFEDESIAFVKNSALIELNASGEEANISSDIFTKIYE